MPQMHMFMCVYVGIMTVQSVALRLCSKCIIKLNGSAPWLMESACCARAADHDYMLSRTRDTNHIGSTHTHSLARP